MTSKDVDNNPIIVSISCITYNHAPFIRQCLDGFMMQKTDFAFEVLIHDDASTDGTAEIIKEYEARYPDVIKPIYEDENQWVKGRRGSAVFNFPRARGKYIALCEGDDYWTDPLKLQKQVDFLEKNPDYVMCSHGYSVYFQQTDQYYINLKEKNSSYSLDFLLDGGWLFQPLTVLYRHSAIENSLYFSCRITMDAVLIYFILKQGLGYYLNDDMAMYRVHDGGVWSVINTYSKMRIEYNARLAIYDVDKSVDAARFILTQFHKDIGREFFVREFRIALRSLLIIYKHMGFRVTLNIIVKRIILGKLNF